MTYQDPVERPYDPASTDYEPEDPELSDVIMEGLRGLSLRLRVALPVKVDAVNGDQKVNLQPLIKARYAFQDETVVLPVLQNCPVLMPRGANYSIRLPVAVGDTGLAVFSDRSLDTWLASAGADPVDTLDSRAHDLNDAVFVPGLVPFSGQTTDRTTDLVITNGNAQLRLLANGTVKMGSIAAGGQELLSILDRLLANQENILSALQTQTFVLTQLGPQPFIASSIAALQQLQATATEIRNNLGTLKVNA